MRKRGIIVLAVMLWAVQAAAQPSPNTGAAPQAFAFFDQNPVAQVYGLPRAGGYTVLAPGRQRLTLHLSQSSHFIAQTHNGETLLFDGATTRAALVYARGLGAGWQARITLPFVAHNGGFADNLINEFHDLFGFGEGLRGAVPDGRQIYRYRRDGQTRLRVEGSPADIGDIRLGLKKRLGGFGDWALTAAAQVKLPTGDAGELTGSGGTDLAVWAVIGNNRRRTSAWRMLAAAGVLYTSDGDVLADLRRNVAAFGWAVLGYALTPRFIVRGQVYLHTPFYDNTSIEALDSVAVQGAFGFEWRLARQTGLSVAMVQDLNAGVTPDVAVLLSLDHVF